MPERQASRKPRFNGESRSLEPAPRARLEGLRPGQPSLMNQLPQSVSPEAAKPQCDRFSGEGSQGRRDGPCAVVGGDFMVQYRGWTGASPRASCFTPMGSGRCRRHAPMSAAVGRGAAMERVRPRSRERAGVPVKATAPHTTPASVVGTAATANTQASGVCNALGGGVRVTSCRRRQERRARPPSTYAHHERATTARARKRQER